MPSKSQLEYLVALVTLIGALVAVYAWNRDRAQLVNGQRLVAGGIPLFDNRLGGMGWSS